MTFSANARAEPVPDPVRFQYDAPPECPDIAVFTAYLRERTARGRAANTGERARTISVSVKAEPFGFLGNLELLDETGASVSRRVSGEQCEAVLASLALITALVLETTASESEPSSALDESPPGTPRPTPLSPAPLPPAPLAPPPRLPASLPTQAAKVELRRSADPGPSLGASVGYDAAIEAWTYGLLGQIAWRSGWALRFLVHNASADREVDAGRSANLRLLGVTTSACYGHLQLKSLSLAPCLGFDLGLLRGKGLAQDNLPHASSNTIGWASLGPELRLAWEPASAFWLELRGNGQFPLLSHEFKFELPERTVYRVPRAALFVGLATGVRFR